MKIIPIYDAAAPIVCTAGGDEVSKRIEQIERIRADLVSIDIDAPRRNVWSLKRR